MIGNAGMSKSRQNAGEFPNIWHLHVFRAALAAGSLSAGGEQLGLTQPAVSQALGGLERFYGTSLAAREGGRLRATPEGAALGLRSGRAFEFLIEGLKECAGLSARQSIQLVRAMSASRLAALAGLVRFGGFAQAARAMGVSSPTLHRAARDLETAIGAEFFEATSFGVRPSRQAETLARYASLAFAELRQAKAEIDAVRGCGSGGTSIGAMPLARSHLVPVAVETFSRDRPAHRVTILEGAYEDLLKGLRRGDIDILVGALREGLGVGDVVQEELFIDALAIVMRAGHPAAGAKKLTRAMLRKFPWVVPRAGSPLRRHFEALFEPESPPPELIECNSLGASRVILMNSERMMLLSDAQIKYEKAAGMLVSRPVPGNPRARSIGLTIRKSWRPTLAQAELISTIRRKARGAD